MSHIPNQQREIYKIAIGLYSAAPGASYFAELNGALEAGMTVSDVYQALANAPSFQLQDLAFAPRSTNVQFTSAFVQRLLGSDVTAAGQSFAFKFVFDRLQAGVSRGEVMKIAIDALDAVPGTDPDFGAAAQRLDNRILVARSFTELLGNGSLDIQFLRSTIATVTSDFASVTAAVAKWSGGLLFDLTPGQDVIGGSFTGNPGDDLFNAPISSSGFQTLNTGDLLSGGGGNDTLKAAISDQDVRPILASIENVDLQFIGPRTVDLSSAPGTEQVIVESSSAVGTVRGLAGVGNLLVRDQQQNVVFDGPTAPELNVTLQRFGAPGAFSDVVLGTANPITVDHLNLTVVDANAQLKMASAGPPPTVTIGASGTNTLRLASPTAGVNTLEITGSGSVDLTGTPLTDLTSLAARSATGAIALSVDASAINVATGAGADTVTYSEPISANSRVDLGAGDDLLVLNGPSAFGAHIEGGAGNDSLKATKGEWIDTAAPAVYSGFETLEIGGGGGTYVMSRLPGVRNVAMTNGVPKSDTTIADAAAGTTLTFSTEMSVGPPTLGTGLITFKLHDATGPNDTLHVTFAGVDKTNNHLSDARVLTELVLPGIEVLDIASNVVAEPALPEFVYQNVLSLSGGTQLDTLRLTGNAHLMELLPSGPGRILIKNVDASLSSGGIDYIGFLQSVPVNFVGSVVKDSFAGTLFGGDTIDAGGGGDAIALSGQPAVNRLIYHAGDSLQMFLVHPISSSVGPISEPLFDTVTNFHAAANGAPGDLIDLSAFAFTDVQRSAITDKGTLEASALAARTPFQPGWFLAGGEAHAVAIGTRPTAPGFPSPPITDVFVDVNNDGDFEITTDLFIELQGVSGLTLNNFVF